MRNILVSGIFDVMHQRFDQMGDFLKSREKIAPPNGVFLAGLPVVVRLDGSSFSKFTKSLTRPFDLRFVAVMDELALELADHFQADAVYVQSDEITLLYSNYDAITFNGYTHSMPYAGKHVKIVTEMASQAASRFMLLIEKHIPEKKGKIAHFDARAYQAFSDDEAIMSVYWRYLDSKKNGVSQQASGFFSHKMLNGKSTRERIEMLNGHENPAAHYDTLPSRLKYGSLRIRELQEKMLTEEELKKIPEKHRPADNKVMRSVWVEKIDIFQTQKSVDEMIQAFYSRRIARQNHTD